MPGMDGYGVAKFILMTQKNWFEGLKRSMNLNRVKGKKECPVVAVTAFTDQSIY